MDRVIILSDTHKNQKLLRQILEREAAGSNYIFHLGDNYEDLDENTDLLENKNIYKVPGIFHPCYLDGSIPPIQEVMIKNWIFILVHNIDDLPDVAANQKIYCYGHSHKLDFRRLDGSYYINPGHLKDDWDKDRPASYSTLEIEVDKILVNFKDKKGTVIQKHIIDRYE